MVTHKSLYFLFLKKGYYFPPPPLSLSKTQDMSKRPLSGTDIVKVRAIELERARVHRRVFASACGRNNERRHLRGVILGWWFVMTRGGEH